MGNLNRNAKTVAKSPLKTVTRAPNARTATGGSGYTSTAQSELFRLGVNALLGNENTYHESGKARDSRFTSLVETVTKEDPQWIAGFLSWLRSEGNVRTASLMGAVTAAHAGLESGIELEIDGKGFNRWIIGAVPQRADEPGELAAYWTAQYGRNLPKPVRRGLADAAGRLYNEYTALKYDTDSKDWRFADVIQMSHASSNRPDLFGYVIADRYGNDFSLAEANLPMIKANEKLRKDAKNDPRVLLDPARLKAAGMTWEDVLSLAGTRIPKKELWEALIDADQLGHMALIRNLRNIEQAGVSKAHIALVINRISNPEIVAKGRQFPFRYWTAYREAGNDAWKYPLAQALDLSTQNIPELDGDTVILIDTSGSMQAPLSNNSKVYRVEAAALFAHALAARNTGKVHIFEFADRCKEVDAIKPGASILNAVAATNRRVGHVGYGTETIRSAEFALGAHPSAKRIFIFTDMQSFADRSYYGSYRTLTDVIPAKVNAYAFDLAGYQVTDLPSGTGNRHQLAGLTDAAFRMVPLLERGRNADWPWLAS